MIKWSCHICGEIREDRNISVRSNDRSDEYNLSYGTFKENVRYCNDNYDCIENSKTYTHLTKKEAIEISNKSEIKLKEIGDKAVEEHFRNKKRFDENMKKVVIFFLYFIAISLLGSFISSISSDETFLEHLFTPWLVPVRLILAYIVFKLRRK